MNRPLVIGRITVKNADAVNGRRNPATYQALIPLRMAAAEVDLISFAVT